MRGGGLGLGGYESAAGGSTMGMVTGCMMIGMAELGGVAVAGGGLTGGYGDTTTQTILGGVVGIASR